MPFFQQMMLILLVSSSALNKFLLPNSGIDNSFWIVHNLIRRKGDVEQD
jgi:hypothetical protein